MRATRTPTSSGSSTPRQPCGGPAAQARRGLGRGVVAPFSLPGAGAGPTATRGLPIASDGPTPSSGGRLGPQEVVAAGRGRGPRIATSHTQVGIWGHSEAGPSLWWERVTGRPLEVV